MIHRDLTAKNVLVNSGLVCKLGDLGVALSYDICRALQISGGTEYDTALDLFSFGVLSIFTLSQQFPGDILHSTFHDHNQKLVARTELERRIKYMHIVYEHVGQDHPLVHIIESCLNDLPSARPKIETVMQIIKQVEAEPKALMDMSNLELLTALQVRSEEMETLSEDRAQLSESQTQGGEVESSDQLNREEEPPEGRVREEGRPSEEARPSPAVIFPPGPPAPPPPPA